MNNIEKHRAFLDSLDGEKGLPDKMHAWRFDDPLQPFDITMFMYRDGEGISKGAVEYLVERCRRAESRQIPDLKEKVKELVRDAMDAVETYRDARWGGEHLDERERKVYNSFRALCAPEKDSKKEAR
jgi:hypothetical protein